VSDSFSLSDKAGPLPEDDLVSVRDVAAPGGDAMEVSEPRRRKAWSGFDAASWYVCVRHASGRHTVIARAGRQGAGRIETPAPAWCAGAHDTPLT
jgi:hypothetical protein